MRGALNGKTEITQPQPNGIVMVKIDAVTGERVAPHQEGIFEFFKQSNVAELPDNGSLVPQDSPLPEDLF
jgi:penicillin-binding protein 1A